MILVIFLFSFIYVNGDIATISPGEIIPPIDIKLTNCYDTDGLDYNTKGSIKYPSGIIREDYCKDDKNIVEYFCEEYDPKDNYYCEEGEKVFEEDGCYCYMEETQSTDENENSTTEIVKKDCGIIVKPALMEDDFKIYECEDKCFNGACNYNTEDNEKTTEIITCVFKNSDKEEKCYTFTKDEDPNMGICSGKKACEIKYEDYNGKKIAWASSCNNFHVYSLQDGKNEEIIFDCKIKESTDTMELEITNGYRYAYWECYDGKEEKEGGETSCKPSSTWQHYAKNACENHCYEDESKCGVNSFSVTGKCFTNEIEVFATTASSSNSVQIIPATFKRIDNIEINGNITLDIEICEDSCSLDGKCYPFGYRKEGKYCSDEGKFVIENLAGASCENNFECSSNLCISNECVSQGLIQRVFDWLKKIFGDDSVSTIEESIQ